MTGLLSKIIITLNSFKNVLRYFCKVGHKSNLCILWFNRLIALYLFSPFPHNTRFIIAKHSFVREEISDVVFFFRHNFNRPLYKNVFLVVLHSCPLPLVLASPKLILYPSPTTFSLCPFLLATPSTAPPFAQ